MTRFRTFLLWAPLLLIILLVLCSIYGAFLGAVHAQEFFNSLPLAAYWFVLGLMLVFGFVQSRRLTRVPSLLLIHLGCVLILAGGMSGSEAGHRIQNKLFGIDKIRRGRMLIHQNEQTNLVKLDEGDQVKELPFSIRLREFRIEYYQPRHLQIQHRNGNQWKIPFELNAEFDLGSQFGKVTILRQFRNFVITFDGDTRKVVDSSEPGHNPALEVQIEDPTGSKITRYVFELFPSHTYPQDQFQLAYGGVIRDYISDLIVIENGKTVAQKKVEVNHPLHFGGYYFYQHSYDQEAAQYTILAIVSDSGLSLVYTGYLALLAGVVWHFWLKHLFTKQGHN